VNLKFIEGYLNLKIDGYWYIENHKLKEGNLFEVIIDNEWVMVSLEFSQGAFYCFPQNQLMIGTKARIEVDLQEELINKGLTKSSVDISDVVNKAFMAKLKTTLGEK